jgi:hypothetical protein
MTSDDKKPQDPLKHIVTRHTRAESKAAQAAKALIRAALAGRGKGKDGK